MNNSYPERLIVVPLESKVLLPSVILRLLIRGKQATDLTKSYFRSANTKSHDIYIACIPMKPCHANAEETAVMGSQAPQVPIPQQDEAGLVSARDRHRLMDYGCLARIIRVQRSGTNLFGVFVEGVSRFRVHQYTQNTPSMAFPGCWVAHVNYFPKPVDVSNANALQFKELSQIFVSKMKELQLPDTLLAQLTKVVNTMPPSALADLLVCLIETTFDERLLMLSTASLDDRLEKACEFLTRQLHVLHISDNLGAGIDGKLSKKQREFYLRQQVSALYIQSGQRQDIDIIYPSWRRFKMSWVTIIKRACRMGLKKKTNYQTFTRDWCRQTYQMKLSRLLNESSSASSDCSHLHLNGLYLETI